MHYLWERESMDKITYGRLFRSKEGRLGRYKYINGRRVAFVPEYKFKQRYDNPKKSQRFGYRKDY